MGFFAVNFAALQGLKAY